MVWNAEPVVSLRVLGTTGHYPSYAIRTRSHIFAPAQNLVWSAVVQRPLGNNWKLGEVYSLLPEEIRLFGAITLSEGDPWTKGYLYPTHRAATLVQCSELGTTRLNSSEAIAKLSERAIQLADASKMRSDRFAPDYIDEYAVSAEIGSHADARLQ
jgi:hypothetical protein